MLRINSISINPNNQIKYMTSPAFGANPPAEEKTAVQTPVQNSVLDYNVKKPMAIINSMK